MNISKLKKIAILALTIFVFVFVFIIISFKYYDYLSDIEELEKNYLESQKHIIVNEVNRALKFINYKYTHSKKDIETTKKEIIDAIENMRDERDGTGYIFIYDFDGVNISDPILTQNRGKNLINFKDPNGKKVIKELINVSKNQNGGFVEYVWNKPTTNKLSPKLSFSKSYKPLNWMVGSGIYMDNIQNMIDKKKVEYKDEVIRFLYFTFIFVFIAFLFIYFFGNYILNKLKKEMEEFKLFFKKASQDYSYIDSNRLYFEEIRELLFFANEMVKDLKTKANELEELNNNLEEKVEEKTKKLKELLQVQDRFVKNAIHEINTPITIMLTNIDLMTLTGEKNRYLSKIEAASKIIHNIYNDLSYAVKKDFHHYEKTKINFSEFLNSRVTFFEEVALANSINFKTNIEDNVFIEFNEIELQRICDNNLSNAIKYSYEESEVEVILRNNELIFENSGNKIENIDKIFNRYYREDSARGGFGIGLNLVKEICDKNEIYIEINSENGINSFKYKGFK